VNSEQHIELWKAATQGDRAALGDLLRSQQDLIFRFCLSQLRSEIAAVDATQETATRILERLETFSGNSRFQTWVLGIANNVCRETRRKESKWKTFEVNTDVFESVNEGTNRVEQAIESDNLHEAVGRLSDRQRQAVVLRYLESLPLSDVAEIMQVSIGTVKATLHQALKKLKLVLAEIHDP
jgi:RNA polymerase sigma-70 factor (ECF subfamily)